MEKQFAKYLREIVPEPKQGRFLLAVSGGMDSCALAHLFFRLHFPFDMAHCNFHLRGDNSDLDMNFVTGLSKKYRTKLFIKEFDTFAIVAKTGKSVEMTARELRYEWFEEIGKEYDYIVTAHHANDNAETVLMNLTRGTGLKGLCGIPVINGKIIRPMLRFPSSEIRRYVSLHQIAYRDDITNFSQQFHRNKIRLAIIPKLEEINPNFIHTNSHNTEIIKEQFNFYQSHIEQIRERLLRKYENGFAIDINDLYNENYPHLILYEILNLFGFNAATIDKIASSLKAVSGKQFYSEFYYILKNRDKLVILPISDKTELKTFVIPDIETMKKLGFDVELHNYQPDMIFDKNPEIFYADAGKLIFPLQLRYWQKGDYFFPFGMKGKKKLSDFFINKKIDIIKKHTIPLLCCKNDIAWVVGLRADNRYKIEKDKTKTYYKIIYYGIF